jgi:hypothetical protein
LDFETAVPAQHPPGGAEVEMGAAQVIEPGIFVVASTFSTTQGMLAAGAAAHGRGEQVDVGTAGDMAQAGFGLTRRTGVDGSNSASISVSSSTDRASRRQIGNGYCRLGFGVDADDVEPGQVVAHGCATLAAVQVEYTWARHTSTSDQADGDAAVLHRLTYTLGVLTLLGA